MLRQQQYCHMKLIHVACVEAFSALCRMGWTMWRGVAALQREALQRPVDWGLRATGSTAD